MLNEPSSPIPCLGWYAEHIKWPSITLGADAETFPNLARTSCNCVPHPLSKSSAVKPSRNEFDKQLRIETNGLSFVDLLNQDV